MKKLFRQEVIDASKDSQYGDIIIPASLGLTFSAVTTIFLLISIALFICLGKYTRKAHLIGIIMPSSGLIKITPQYTGYVTDLMVSEGQHVHKGQPLYRISGERYDGQGAGTLSAISHSLNTQHSMLASQQTLEQQGYMQQQNAVTQRIIALQPQITSAEQRLRLAESQAIITISVMDRYKKLLSSHFVSDIEYQQKQIEVVESKVNIENQRQSLLQLRTTLKNEEDSFNHITALAEARKVEIERQLQVIRQQQVELASQENFILNSPVNGSVGAVLIKQGQSAKAFEPVMTLIPDDAPLQVELYATSKNSGFIQVGQRVALRFAAFPYQKFGVQYGTIREVSRITLTQSELLAVFPVAWKENEGHYRVIVEPERPYIIAYGKRELLLPGMTLEGDISLDTRYLWEWLTEPLWIMKGKI